MLSSTNTIIIRANETRADVTANMAAAAKALSEALSPPKAKEPRMKARPIRREKLPGRNDKCPCGSGKKAKRCCLNRIKVFASLPLVVREQVAIARILGHNPFVDENPPPVPEAVTDAFNAVSEGAADHA
jgi:hypothetical protein